MGAIRFYMGAEGLFSIRLYTLAERNKFHHLRMTEVVTSIDNTT